MPLPLVIVEEIGSTSEALRRLAAEGGGETALLAYRQSAGQGRLGRPWRSVAGNLHLSVLLRPGTLRFPGHWSILMAVALAEVVRAGLPDPAALRLKWPNDLLLAGGKLAGILIEAGSDRAGMPWLVVGCGVNLAGVPEGLDRKLSSLADVMVAPEREVFAGALLGSLEGWRTLYQREGFEPVRQAWSASAHRPGDWLRIVAGERVVEGAFEGLGDDAGLVLRGPAGMRTVTTGEVS